MRFTFAAPTAQAPRRHSLMIWLRRAFDMVVIGAMLFALMETVSFLRGLLG
ncbi:MULTISPECIES: hypothetical protein [Phenylobacterium]|uniref:Uncharacterized protein n=1 Tax=Phenylobacterium koreense TaxID=266125 RepID=A0ABV2EMI5_9CAUL